MPCLLASRVTFRNCLGSQLAVWFFTSCFLFPITGEVKGATQRFYSPQSGKNKARSCLNLIKEEFSFQKIEEGNWFWFLFIWYLFTVILLWGASVFQTLLNWGGGRGLTETGGFYLSGGLLNLAKKKVSLLHNDLESEVQDVGGHAAKEKNKSELTGG